MVARALKTDNEGPLAPWPWRVRSRGELVEVNRGHDGGELRFSGQVECGELLAGAATLGGELSVGVVDDGDGVNVVPLDAFEGRARKPGAEERFDAGLLSPRSQNQVALDVMSARALSIGRGRRSSRQAFRSGLAAAGHPVRIIRLRPTSARTRRGAMRWPDPLRTDQSRRKVPCRWPSESIPPRASCLL